MHPMRLAALLACALGVSACSGSASPASDSDGSTNRPLSVAASFYPIAEIVGRVGGDDVDVIDLTPAGTDAHDVEVTARQLERLESADIAFYLGGHFQPSVEKSMEALARIASVDLLDHVPTMTIAGSDESDPHVWLDPQNMIAMTREVTARLTALRPDIAGRFEQRSGEYIDELTALGRLIDTSLTSCTSRVLVTAHRSFGYFAKRANLSTYSLLDYNGEDATTSKDLEKFTAFLRTNNVSTMFYEELISKSTMETIADKIGLATATLDPIESITRDAADRGASYLSIQRENVTTIAEGLGCS